MQTFESRTSSMTDVRTADARTPQQLERRSATSAASDIERPRGATWIAMLVVALITAGGLVVLQLDDAPTAVALPTAAPADASEGSMARVVDQVGARQLWAQGITGAGVNVALIDTGVAPVAGLDGDKIAAVVDLSAEQDDPSLRFTDSNGHGTHLAGIIAGRESGTSDDRFLGVAPDAGIVSVKVAGRDGDVSPDGVVTGIDWVIDHADELDIRVVNLALDTGSAADYRSDALAAAVERAWQAGIVVVTAAGNGGLSADGLNLPASDPFVIAVAGADFDGDEAIAGEWTSRGDGVRNPDVAAPGAHIESLRAPGSDADVNHSDGYVDEMLFKGTGSSQSAAVVSGLVALLLQERPDLSPDEVKSVLTGSALAIDAVSALVGHGLVQVDAAVDAEVANATQTWTPADTATITRQPGISMIAPEWAGSSWAGSSWAGSSWAGSSWAGSSWAGSSWAGSSWAGSSWAGSSWAGSSWAGSSWAGSSWAGSSWAGSSWAGSSWAGSSWAGSSWAGSSWAGSSWAGSSWA